jgi:hypothetical protein
VTRVIRMQRLDQSASYAPSFQRSLDVPPKPHVLLPDTHVVLQIIANQAAPAAPSAPRWLHPANDPLPPRIPLASPRSLRAPPLA